jgi:[ribosomal protein S5]-alanine N-acetyltransferase
LAVGAISGLDDAVTIATARMFPDCVPVLRSPDSEVLLRAHREDDLAAMLEQSVDPETRRWTTVPLEYGPVQAEEFRSLIIDNWQAGRSFSWAIEADRDGVRQYCGTIDLRPLTEALSGGAAEVGFALHPGARGRSIMKRALRLIVDHGFDDLGLQVIRWQSIVGNLASRRIAYDVGFRYDGTIRLGNIQRDQLRDCWVATITRDDQRAPDGSWLDQPVLESSQVRLRPWRPDDAPRIVEACSDQRTQHWLTRLPQPYTTADAISYLNGALDGAATGIRLSWCVADPATDLALASVGAQRLYDYAKRTEIGYWAHPDARGRGVVTEAVRLVSEYLFDAGLARSVEICAARGNAASRHVAQAAGYRESSVLPAGVLLRDGSTDDLIGYQLLPNRSRV